MYDSIMGHIQCEAQVFGCVCHSVRTGSGGKRRGIPIQGGCRIQRLYMEVFHSAAVPVGFFAQYLVVSEGS